MMPMKRKLSEAETVKAQDEARDALVGFFEAVFWDDDIIHLIVDLWLRNCINTRFFPGFSMSNIIEHIVRSVLFTPLHFRLSSQEIDLFSMEELYIPYEWIGKKGAERLWVVFLHRHTLFKLEHKKGSGAFWMEGCRVDHRVLRELVYRERFVVALAYHLLKHGTSEYHRRELSVAFDRLSAEFEKSTFMRHIAYTVRCHNATAESVLYVPTRVPMDRDMVIKTYMKIVHADRSDAIKKIGGLKGHALQKKKRPKKTRYIKFDTGTLKRSVTAKRTSRATSESCPTKVPPADDDTSKGATTVAFKAPKQVTPAWQVLTLTQTW